MDNQTIEEMIEDAIWVGNSLFQRGKVSGSTANMSFRKESDIYITATGSCFGRLSKDAFSIVRNGKTISEIPPSKEILLHDSLYKMDKLIKAVIHTHSTFATYWSCVLKESEESIIPTLTPYLSMKIGKIGWVPYAKPGSNELFEAFEKACLKRYKCYLLENHGVIVGGATLLDAFYMLEELEEAAKNAWLLQLK